MKQVKIPPFIYTFACFFRDRDDERPLSLCELTVSIGCYALLALIAIFLSTLMIGCVGHQVLFGNGFDDPYLVHEPKTYFVGICTFIAIPTLLCLTYKVTSLVEFTNRDAKPAE